MTLSELMADDPVNYPGAPDWSNPATTDESIAAWLNESVAVPTSDIHVPSSNIAALLSMAEVASWGSYTGAGQADVRAAREMFGWLLSGAHTIQGDRLVEQADALLAVGVLSQATRDAAVALTTQMQTRAQIYGVGKVSPFLVSEVR